MTNVKLTMLPIILLFIIVLSSHSQVTIGNNLEPARAALLQLKTQETNNPLNVTDDGNVTSTSGGLLLPRVKLTNINTMEPFIPVNDPDWVNNNSTKIKEIHAGLMVYNLSNTGDFNPGIYIWDGNKWEESKAATIKIVADNGLTLDGDRIQLGGTLIKTTEINQGDHDLNLTGKGKFNISVPLKIDSIFKVTTGAGQDKVLMSDEHGNASWKTLDELPPTPTAVLSDNGITLNIPDGTYYNTNSYIILPPGRWFVQVTMVAEMPYNINTSNFYWLRSTFVREGENAPNNKYFEGTNSIISGKLNGSKNLVKGFVIIKHSAPNPVKFYYYAGQSEVTAGGERSKVSDFGGKKNSENNIVAFPMI